MGFNPFKIVKKAFKKVTKFIKRGVKKVAKFFKRALQGVGKFIGKLGPIGMLGMMIMMPTMGAWWGQFGGWASKLAGSSNILTKGFGYAMKGIHAAGTAVGKAYSTVTETMDSALGGFADAVGLGDQYEGIKTWMNEKVTGVQESLGLQTNVPATSIGTDYVAPGEQDLSTTELYDPQAGRVEAGIDSETLTEKLSTTGDYTGTASETGTGIESKSLMDPTSTFDKIVDIGQKGKEVYDTYQENFGGDQSVEDQYLGSLGVAEASVFVENSINQANVDYARDGNMGQSPYLANDLNLQIVNSELSKNDNVYAEVMGKLIPRFVSA